METEFKYRLSDKSVLDRIADDARSNNQIKGDIDSIEMEAVYFDTEDQELRDNGVAYRIRRENDIIIATVKWDLDIVDGLYVREEINLVVNDENFAENPDIELFKSSGAYDVLYEATGGRKLVKQVDMEYTRRQLLVNTGSSLSCISEDFGTIHRKDKEDVPVFELEIELYHGDENDFRDLAAGIREKYGLEVEPTSKLQRAFS